MGGGRRIIGDWRRDGSQRDIWVELEPPLEMLKDRARFLTLDAGLAGVSQASLRSIEDALPSSASIATVLKEITVR